MRWRSRRRPRRGPVRPRPSGGGGRDRHRGAGRRRQRRLRLLAPRADLGPVADDLHRDVADLEPRPRARCRAASASSATPTAPASSGRSVPKCAPRSPRPAAENSASQAAWAATSASEWPARPRSPGQSRPATHSSRPSSANGVDVDADADRGGSRAVVGRRSGPAAARARRMPRRSACRTVRARSRSRGVVDLERARVAVDDGPARRSSTRAASSVAPDPPAWRALEHVAPEALRRLDRPQRARVGGVESRRPAASTSLTVSTTGRPGTTAGLPAAAPRRRPRSNSGDGREGARRVVDQHDVVVGRQGAPGRPRPSRCARRPRRPRRPRAAGSRAGATRPAPLGRATRPGRRPRRAAQPGGQRRASRACLSSGRPASGRTPWAPGPEPQPSRPRRR